VGGSPSLPQDTCLPVLFTEGDFLLHLNGGLLFTQAQHVNTIQGIELAKDPIVLPEEAIADVSLAALPLPPPDLALASFAGLDGNHFGSVLQDIQA
jgi:hypothetical protein